MPYKQGTLAPEDKLDMAPAFAVELRNVSKYFGDVIAVDDVSLGIANQEFFSLLGPSGCGKTTTLRMIAGFELPSSGEISIQSKPIGSTPPYHRPVNTVFQSYALFPHLTVAQNIDFGLQMHRVPKLSREQRVTRVLQLVRLEGFQARWPRQLSGGQQQRVALARALVNEPAVLLLDEPLGALDLKLRKELQLELRALQNRVGITFIYVTHDQEEALTMSDRIAVMNKGKVLQVGTPTEIYERPACRFVADFIGESNFLEGTVVSISGNRAIVRVSDEIVIEGMAPNPLLLGGKATVAVRPEKIHLDRHPPEGNRNVFPVRIERIVYVGADTRVFARLYGKYEFVIKEQNRRVILDSDESYAEGGSAYVSWPVDNAFILTE